MWSVIGLSVCAALAVVLRRHESESRAPQPTTPAPAPDASPPRSADAPPAISTELVRPPAGQRTPTRVPPTTDGIRCPDGTYLPLLNGVTSAPAIIREPERGPLPPVVARMFDAEGFEWYEHADGSMTTSRPHRIKDQLGRESVQTVTLHLARQPDAQFVGPDARQPSNK